MSESIESLRRWGWSPYFHQQFLTFAEEHPHLALHPGRVVSVRRCECLVVDGTDPPRRAVLAGRLAHQPDTVVPCVGDFVVLHGDGHDLGRIEHVLERATLFQRKRPGLSSVAQPIAANIDLAIVVAAVSPDESGERNARRGVNLHRIERYLYAIGQASVRSLVAVNKADLCSDAPHLVDVLRTELGGAEVVPVSAHCGTGFELLEPWLLPGTTAVLLGSSGVGKSSIINRLLGFELRRAGSIREADGRGRHTTTDRELFALPNGALLIDTPGMRELGLSGDTGRSSAHVKSDDEPAARSRGFDAFAERCRFRDCRHQGEPGCAVHAAIERGELAAARLEHAQKLERELAWQRRRHEALLRSAEKKRRRPRQRTRDEE